MRIRHWLVLPLTLWVGLAGCSAGPLPDASRIGTDRASVFHARDGWLYFSNLQEEGRLARIRPDGSAREVLADIPGAILLGFDGPAVFFGLCRFEDNPKHDWTIDELYRIPNAGAPAAKIADVAMSFLDPGFIAAGNSVFFNGGDPNHPVSLRLDLASGQIETRSPVPVQQAERGPDGAVYLSREGDSGGIERWDLNATAGVPVLSESVQEFTIAGDSLYFASARDVAPSRKSRTGRLYRLPLAGGPPVRLDDGGSSGLQADGDWLYYTQGGWGPLHRTRLDGSKTERLHSGQVLWPVLAPDWIYFTSGSPLEAFGSKLCRIRRDGSGLQTLSKARGQFVAAANDWACFMTVDDDTLIRIAPLTP